MKLLRSAFLLLHTVAPAWAHTRLECPPPRSGATGQKTGPCDAPDDPSLPAFPLQPNAFNTITWLESIAHPGAPGRIALSLDGDDSAESFERCLLLDHIPHDEHSQPNFRDEKTWHRSSITVWIPDVYCERCHLQLITIMTDEIHGVPEGTSCAYEGALQTDRVADGSLKACREVYHSCAPVSIAGATPRNDIGECDTAAFEEKLGWPLKPSDSNAGLFDYSTYFFKGDPGLYAKTDSRMMRTGAPLENCPTMQFYCDPAVYFVTTNEVPVDASYTRLEGTCAAVVAMQVEPFAFGKLPGTAKDDGAADAAAAGGGFGSDAVKATEGRGGGDAEIAAEENVTSAMIETEAVRTDNAGQEGNSEVKDQPKIGDIDKAEVKQEIQPDVENDTSSASLMTWDIASRLFFALPLILL